jgi:putative tryptophan/tyrosine transport system substrate-binding protein
MKLVGLFMNLAECDSDVAHRKAAFKRGLKGFTEGDDVRLEYRYGGGDFPNYPQLAKQLVGLRPDVIFAACGPSFRALETEMQSANVDIPLVFAGLIDPTPEANLTPSSSHIVTGFISYRADLCTKWPHYLKRMAKHLTHAAILYDPGSPLRDNDPDRKLGETQRDSIRKAAGQVELDASTLIDVTASKRDVERDVANFAKKNAGKGGLVVPGATLAATSREFIARLAIEYRLPAIYANRMYTQSGGLMSYGAKTLKIYESSAERVAKILNHEHVEGPTHRTDFELVINSQAADAIGLKVPADLLSEAE